MVRLFAFVALFLAGCATQQQIPTPNEVLGADLPRAALVIGNGSYQSVASLQNPAADAGAIAGALKSAGYRVHKGGALVDLGRTEMEQEIAAFAAEVSRTGGIAFVYYAGHGIQVDGRNYLIPVDAGIATTTEIPSETVDLQSLLSALEAPNIEMKVIVIDACRDNPFELATAEKPIGSRTSRGDPGLRSLSSGLSELIAPPGALVAFATAPGSVALDGAGKNSPYAAALANVVGEPGLRVEDVFISVRNRVRAETRGVQVPWETSSLTSVAAFSGAARTGAEPTSVFAEAPTTSVWDGRYLAEVRCGPIFGNTDSGPIRRLYSPRIERGIARSEKGGQTTGDFEWRISSNGTVTLKGSERSRGGASWSTSYSGRMKNGEATLRGQLGSRDCEVTLWREGAAGNPISQRRKLSGAEIRSLLVGRTLKNEISTLVFQNTSAFDLIITNRGGPTVTHREMATWNVKSDLFCNNNSFRGYETCWAVFYNEDVKDPILIVNEKDGRAWLYGIF